MAPETEQTWRRLSDVKAWTPLIQVAPSAALVADGLYRVTNGIYVLTVPFNERLEADENGPFVTLVFLAASDGSAQRAALNRVEADDGRLETLPASVVENAPHHLTYEALTSARLGVQGAATEYAVYAMDGRFVHKVLDFGDLQFLFRHNASIETESPYALVARLRR